MRTRPSGDQTQLAGEGHHRGQHPPFPDAAGVDAASRPEVPPWIKAFTDYYCERFGERLVLPEIAQPHPSIACTSEIQRNHSVSVPGRTNVGERCPSVPHDFAVRTPPLHPPNVSSGGGRPQRRRKYTFRTWVLSVLRRLFAHRHLRHTNNPTPPFAASPTKPAGLPAAISAAQDPSIGKQTLLGYPLVRILARRYRSLRSFLVSAALIFFLLFLAMQRRTIEARNPELIAALPLRLGAPAPLPPAPATLPGAPELQRLPQPATLTGIEHSSTSQSTTVILRLHGTPSYSVNRLSGPERIFIDFTNTGATAAVLSARSFSGSVPCLRKGRVAYHSTGVTRVTFETAQFCEYSTELAPNPSRLIVAMQPRHPRP